MKERTSGLLAAAVVAFSLTATLLVLNSCGKPAWMDEGGTTPGEDSPVPYPGFRGGDFAGEKNFATLINNYAEAKSVPTPWAGYWWPYTTNGIASGVYGGGSSPAGKYDAARGRQTNAQGWEVKNHGAAVPKIQPWWGHCNGWTAASSLYPEPRAVSKVNGISFDVADVKALLTEAAMEVSADFFGERVDWGQDYALPKFTDTVPDQFFLVLTNYMGRLGKAVLIDRYTGDQVWNQPMAGYKFQYPKPADYLGPSPTAPNVHRIMLTGRIWWVSDEVVPSVITPTFRWEDNEIYTSRELKMELWLDGPVVFDANGKIQSSGNLIVGREGDYFAGGAWRMGDGFYNDGWPDYMWVAYSVIKPTDYANAEIDIQWVEKHILPPGGVDDPTSSPRPVDPAPSPRPTPSSFPSGWPTNWPQPPNPRPTLTPEPTPTGTMTPIPRPTVTHTPDPIPTTTGTPTPIPTPTRPAPRPTGGR